jgi:CheY-like chemotaxis protein
LVDRAQIDLPERFLELDGAYLKNALEAVPDVILCDLGLPGGMDGFDSLMIKPLTEESLRKLTR